jgi:putative RNA 2'-phosphotransferase
MNTKQYENISKFLSFILRHKPESIGLHLDDHGWARIESLINKTNQSTGNPKLSYDTIIEVVDTNEKTRFSRSEDGLSIRANQGHSIEVDLGLTPATPPPILYHGTATRFISSILKEGLRPGKRQHVHLSTDIETARQVGQRYGKPVILTIDSNAMLNHGYEFYLSDNGVWLTDRVPSNFLREDGQI